MSWIWDSGRAEREQGRPGDRCGKFAGRSRHGTPENRRPRRGRSREPELGLERAIRPADEARRHRTKECVHRPLVGAAEPLFSEPSFQRGKVGHGHEEIQVVVCTRLLAQQGVDTPAAHDPTANLRSGQAFRDLDRLGRRQFLLGHVTSLPDSDVGCRPSLGHDRPDGGIGRATPPRQRHLGSGWTRRARRSRQRTLRQNGPRARVDGEQNILGQDGHCEASSVDRVIAENGWNGLLAALEELERVLAMAGHRGGGWCVRLRHPPMRCRTVSLRAAGWRPSSSSGRRRRRPRRTG